MIQLIFLQTFRNFCVALLQGWLQKLAQVDIYLYFSQLYTTLPPTWGWGAQGGVYDSSLLCPQNNKLRESVWSKITQEASWLCWDFNLDYPGQNQTPKTVHHPGSGTFEGELLSPFIPHYCYQLLCLPISRGTREINNNNEGKAKVQLNDYLLVHQISPLESPPWTKIRPHFTIPSHGRVTKSWTYSSSLGVHIT